MAHPDSFCLILYINIGVELLFYILKYVLYLLANFVKKLPTEWEADYYLLLYIETGIELIVNLQVL
ncbi:hypothetical protein [Clostridium tertium]|uniref:hypothetical protein n=1 Tax=Clostridium tertium TaxID=1559 RepID=UPI0023B33A76|nr:hypothetical protein [Clostridium tertium]